MPRYVPEPIPMSFEPILREYLDRELRRISDAIITQDADIISTNSLTATNAEIEDLTVTGEAILNEATVGDLAVTGNLTLDGAVAMTATAVGTTAAGVGTYSVQEASFVQIANVVFIFVNLTWTAHTGTGNIRINLSGHPTPASVLVPLACNYFSVGTVTDAATARLLSTTQIEPLLAQAAIPMDTAATMRFAGFYFV